MKTETFGTCLGYIPPQMYGLIYLVKEKDSGLLYVGRKNFYTNKGKESDWKTYCTSHLYLKTAIKKNYENYEFKILTLCKDETSTKIAEVEQILKYNTLDPLVGLNANVILNIRRSIPDLTKRKLTLTEGDLNV